MKNIKSYKKTAKPPPTLKLCALVVSATSLEYFVAALPKTAPMSATIATVVRKKAVGDSSQPWRRFMPKTPAMTAPVAKDSVPISMNKDMRIIRLRTVSR